MQFPEFIVYTLNHNLSEMNDRFDIYESIQGDRIFKIEEDYPEVGVYLYIYENENCIKDYLQNDINTCKLLAFEEYNVPMDSWEQLM